MRARRFSVRALWGLASWALPLAVVFVVTPFLLRALGPERFGVLMIILVTPLLAGQLEFGISSSSVRTLAAALATGRVDAGRTLATFAVALGFIGIASGAVVWALAPTLSQWLGFVTVLGEDQSTVLVRWCAVWVAVSLLTLMPGMLARSAQALALITAVQTFAAALLWLGALAVVKAGRPLSEIVTVGIALSLVCAGATAIAMRRHVDWSGPINIDLKLLAADRRFSAGMFASQAASALVYQGDRILISAIGSPAMAGIYALCANVANKMLAAVVALTSFAFPHAAGLHAVGDDERLQALSDALERGVVVIVMPVLLPGVLLAQPFLKLWLGDFSNAEVVATFRILWIAFAIPAFAVPVASLLAAKARAGLAARFAWLTAIVVVGAITVFVPLYGARGAAFAMLLGMASSLVFRSAARKALALRTAPDLGRLWWGVISGLAAQLVLLIVCSTVQTWPALFAVGAASISVFFLVRAILRLLSPEEELLLQQLAARQRRAGKL